MTIDAATQQFLQKAHLAKKKIVFVSGVFDLLHDGHRAFLKNAKQCGDILVVAIESDVRVKKIKGLDRPIHSQKVRKEALLQLAEVDFAFVLPEKFDSTEDHFNILQLVKPHVLAVSSHTNYIEKKRELVEKVGGKLKIVMEHDPAISTTKIINEGAVTTSELARKVSIGSKQ